MWWDVSFSPNCPSLPGLCPCYVSLRFLSPQMSLLPYLMEVGLSHMICALTRLKKYCFLSLFTLIHSYSHEKNTPVISHQRGKTDVKPIWNLQVGAKPSRVQST